MGIGTNLAAIAGAAGGALLTALILWRHERRREHALLEVTHRLRTSEARLQALVRDSSDVIAVVGDDGTLSYVSPAAERLLGRPVAEMVGRPPAALVHSDDRERVDGIFNEAREHAREVGPFECRVLHSDGTYRLVEMIITNLLHDSAVEGLVVNTRDITERRRAEAELREAQERFRSAFEHAPIGMALTSLDGRLFRVNRALIRILGRAEDQLLGASVLALTHPEDRDTMCLSVERLLSGEVPGYQLETRSLHADGHAVWIALSMSLVRDVDGRPLYMVSQVDRAVQHLRTGTDLHRALDRRELCLHYQPIVNLVTGRITGFEALLRWNHPQRGMIPPDEFIRLAEETGLIVPIGRWALEEACVQAVKWHVAGTPVTMSVNLSPRQVAEPGLAADVARVLQRTRVPTGLVWLEITENTLMRDAESAVSTLGALRSLGVHLAVDDFGTGYSSLSYLQRFPVEALKVDRAFVDGLGRVSEATVICTAVVSLAHALGLRAVAEGVETTEQLAALRTLGCELAQGYLFGRPQPAEAHRLVVVEESALPRREQRVDLGTAS